jgi:hypothetical protein
LLVTIGLTACVQELVEDEERDRHDPAPAATTAGCGTSPDGSTEEHVFYQAATVPYGEQCQPQPQSCTCAAGQWLCPGPFAKATCQVLCPPNATRVGGTDQAPLCECLPGYVMQGTACLPACPSHSHADATGQQCVCDADYFANAQGNACVPGDELCPAHSHYQPQPDGALHCQCDAGYVVDWDKDACVLPGEECPAGHPKMVVNGKLIICCPAEALAVSYSSETGPTCVCPEGQSYDAQANECG